jgi:hypothetical protein
LGWACPNQRLVARGDRSDRGMASSRIFTSRADAGRAARSLQSCKMSR